MDATNRIPLAEVLRTANALQTESFIEDYAIGGAIAAIFYVEPFATFDIDLFYIPINDALDAGIPAMFERLRQWGWTALIASICKQSWIDINSNCKYDSRNAA